MQLQVNPLLYRQFSNLIDVSWTRTERQSVQGVNDLLILWKSLIEAASGSNEKSGSSEEGCEAQPTAEAFHRSLPFEMISSLYTLGGGETFIENDEEHRPAKQRDNLHT